MKKFLDAYYHNWFSISDLYEQFAKRHKLSSSALFLLQLLLQGACTQRELCRLLVLPKQTVHSILKVFLSNDWVTTEISTEDKRERVVALTDSGKRFAAPILQQLNRIEEQALHGLSSEERAAMTATYQHFADCLQQAMQENREVQS